MASCDLTDTGHNKVEFVFNIRKRYRFKKKVSFLLKKRSLSPEDG